MKLFSYCTYAFNKVTQASCMLTGLVRHDSEEEVKAILWANFIKSPDWIRQSVLVNEVCEANLVNHAVELAALHQGSGI